MKLNPEQKIIDAIKAHIKGNGGFVIKTNPSLLAPSGIPDLIGGYKGKPFAVEVKAEKGRVSKLQLAWIARFNKQGYVTGIAHSVEEFEGLFI